MTVVKSNATDILKTYLTDHGIKKSFVAYKLGMSPANFSNTLNGRRKFDADMAIRVSKILELDPNIFLQLS